MQLQTKMNDALNTQINEELFSFYLYLSMAAWFESSNLKGIAHWLQVQAREEQAHAMRIYNYIHESGGIVSLKAIKEPKMKWDSPAQAFEESVKHEEYITACIGKLVELSMSEKDYATLNMLQWFVNEQVEEEANPREVLMKLKMIGVSQSGLLYLDKEMKKRE